MAPMQTGPNADKEQQIPPSARHEVEPFQITELCLQTSSAEVSCFEAGDISDLPALLLLPGLACSGEQFMSALLPLAERTKLLSLDWRGHGRSSPKEDVTLADLAADAMRLIQTRFDGAAKLCIIGHSMGGRVLWNMWEIFQTELAPMLAGVAVIDQAPSAITGKVADGPADVLHGILRADSQRLSAGKTEMLGVFEDYWAAPDSGFMPSPEAYAHWLQFSSDCDPSSLGSLHWDTITSDFAHVTDAMKCKLLMMVGDSTIAASSITERYGPVMPEHGAHFALFVGGTHCLHVQEEQLSKLTSLLMQLLDGSLEFNSSKGNLGGATQTLSSAILNDTSNEIKDTTDELKPLKQHNKFAAEGKQLRRDGPSRSSDDGPGMAPDIRRSSPNEGSKTSPRNSRDGSVMVPQGLISSPIASSERTSTTSIDGSAVAANARVKERTQIEDQQQFSPVTKFPASARTSHRQSSSLLVSLSPVHDRMPLISARSCSPQMYMSRLPRSGPSRGHSPRVSLLSGTRLLTQEIVPNARSLDRSLAQSARSTLSPTRMLHSQFPLTARSPPMSIMPFARGRLNSA